MKRNLCPTVEAEGRDWRFCGVWARNCKEWLLTELAGLHYNITNVGFYEAMSPNSSDFIIKQT
jgi:long-subunit acyl-CoA synthetase (AMP-forming)